MLLLPRTTFIKDTWSTHIKDRSFTVLPIGEIEEYCAEDTLCIWVESVTNFSKPAIKNDNCIFLVQNYSLALRLSEIETFSTWIFFPDTTTTLDLCDTARMKLCVNKDLRKNTILQECDFSSTINGSGISARLMQNFAGQRLLYDLKAGSDFHFGLSEPLT